MSLFRRTLGTALLFGVAALADPIAYVVDLNGHNESPANSSPGTGTGRVIFDTVAHTLQVSITFADLLGTTTASHMHCCTPAPFSGSAGVATQIPRFEGFPVGVTSGTYSHAFDTSLDSTFNPAFVAAHGGTPAGAEAFLAAGAAEGRAYLNIHSSLFPGGEIRGFLQPVPEPSSILMAGAMLAGLVLRRMRR